MAEARHVVAVVGGATAGAEIAGLLAERGAVVVVFEQNLRPYGKIEDGLPRWHVALRRKEYGIIAEKLSRPGVHFVPNTRIGKDIPFEALTRDWGFSAVVLAIGAWRDRPVPVEGADDYVGRGLVYQNPFIIWFNHCNEKAYHGETFEPMDGVLVVGGGLASIDVVKVLMLETTRAALRERGIDVDMVQLEVKGIPKTLATHGLAWEDLGLEGCTLFYRRRPEDMPLVEIPPDAPEKRREKVLASRKKLLEKAMDKYRFKVEPLCMPDGLLVEDGRLVGLRFRRTEMKDGRPVPTDETFERRGPYVISSIGSIPAPIAGIPMKGELYDFADWEFGRLADYPNVFSAGNVVTGKGNIVASRKHAGLVGAEVIGHFLGLADDQQAGHAGEEKLAEAAAEASREQAKSLAKQIERAPELEPAQIEAILEHVRARQQQVGYTGDLASWLEKVTPPDLE